ncbi:ATP-dependent DNA helicase RecG [Candidatus Palauibacter sp.]|uniref:ATP-dependent DNA helicase RecG n=1 Tax=Candidatus Palauibacter sp. TaxID=3101350 RepID=UPI003B525BF1
MTPARSLLRGPVQYLKGVGPRRSERFAQLGVHTGRDLLYHLPYRYEDATTVDAIAGLQVGQDATVIGRVVSKGVIPTRQRLRVFRAVIRDDSGHIELAWPGRPWLDRTIDKGDLLLAAGPVRFYHGRQLQPREHTVLARRSDDAAASDDGVAADERPAAGRVFPVYGATKGLTHRQVRAVVRLNLSRLLAELGDDDPIPRAWLAELSLPPLAEALHTLHRPPAVDRVTPSQRRLAFEELFFLQLLHARARARLRHESEGIAFDAPPTLTQALPRALPFELTRAQRRVWADIEADMRRPTPMNRLLQGDVGSGKTVVAALAMLKAIEGGRQAAIMAPTELLAEQHQRTFVDMLGPLGVEPVLLTGSVTGKARQDALERIADGRARFVVGTHALIQDAVEFASPGLVVIDEQHRFGVEQRRRLRESGQASDALVMSATPIPRSLALVLYGDLDLSVIDELPPGRRTIRTAVRGPGSREAAFDFVGDQMAAGRQAYVVYPLVEESETLEARAATVMFESLQTRFADFNVRLLHGRLSSGEKEEAMRGFLAGETQLLVATTVIEVGIDVPNATVMLVEDAERFGLAQLHQLRGRVGRGAEQSYCIVFHAAAEPSERLRAFEKTSDGFKLAEDDLRIRGQGDLFGKEQHGTPLLRFAQLDRDHDLLEDARRRARAIVADDPGLTKPAHRALRHALDARYAQREALYHVG